MTWNSFKEPRPYCAVIGFAFDKRGRFPILYRSDKVRSAKNLYSLVAGLHEVGRSVTEQFATECKEELNLDVCGEAEQIGFFEEIIPEDNWHWIMLIVAAPVTTLDVIRNMEPEKHSDLSVVDVDQFFGHRLNLNWSKGAKPAFRRFQKEITQAVKKHPSLSYDNINRSS